MTKSINYNDRKSRFETFVNLLWLLTYPWKSKNQKDMYQTFILHKFHIEYGISMTTHVLNIITSNIIGMYIFGTRIVVPFYEQLTYFLFLPAIAA